MYSWEDDLSDWYNPSAYAFDPKRQAAREADAARAREAGPREYQNRTLPALDLIDPKRTLRTHVSTPVILGIDVTHSMQTWPAKIFESLPLLYKTLSQYRPDVEISFAAIGDAAVDRFPLQATDFAKGYDLEALLAAIFGEGGGGDAPESYGLFARFVETHVVLNRTSQQPWLIVFGDQKMHEVIPAAQISYYLGDRVEGDLDAVECWNRLNERWNVWFLRSPGGEPMDAVDQQWARAIGDQKIVHLPNEDLAVDYAMGLMARAWGTFDDFTDNLRARHPEDVVAMVTYGVKRAFSAKPSVPPPAPPPESTATISCSSCNYIFEATGVEKGMCPRCGAMVEV